MSASSQSAALRESIDEQLVHFANEPARVRKALRELFSSDPAGFCVAAIPFLLDDQVAGGIYFLYELLTGKAMLPICDPGVISFEDDLKIARAALALDPMLDVKLARRLGPNPHDSEQRVDPRKVQRILELLAVICDGNRILPILIKVLRDPDPRLRSKAALLIGRSNKSAQWVEQVMKEADARVRANALEALWGIDTESARAIFHDAVRDTNNRVVGNALLGLYQLGDPVSVHYILRMAAHTAPLFRSTAAWTMGQTGDPRFLPALAHMVREPDTGARHSVFHAIARLKQTVARNAEAPRLRVVVYSRDTQPDGSQLIRTAITQDDGSAVPRLRATDVVLWEGSRLVVDYTVRRPQPDDWLAMGIVLPAARICPQASGKALQETAQLLIERKRSGDRCGILCFGNVKQGPSDGGVPPACSFTSDAPTLVAGLKEAGQFGYSESVQSQLNYLGATAGNKHVLVFEDRSDGALTAEIPQPRWALLARNAQADRIVIDAIVLTSPEREPGPLAAICRNSGGLYLETPDASGLPALADQLRYRLQAPYDIEYLPLQPGTREDLRIQIYHERGCANETLPPDSPAA